MARIKPQQLLLQSKKKKGPSKVSLITIVTFNLIAVLVLLSFTYRHWRHRSSSNGGDELENSELHNFGESKQDNLPTHAVFNTAKGSITVELHKDASPDLVEKFVALCQKGYFKGMLFHRVIKNFVIQGGHSLSSSAAGDWISRVKENSQLATSPKHEAFMLGTTKSNADGKEFDLFITTAPISDLKDKIILFGRVVKGEDIVQEIEEIDTDEHYRPKSPLGIIDVVLKQEV